MKLCKFFILIIFTYRITTQDNSNNQQTNQTTSQPKLSYWDQIVHNINIQHKGKTKSKSLNDFGLLSIKKDEYNHIKAYLFVKRKAKQKSQSYLSCINQISNSSFSSDNIEHCVGKDFQYLKFDFDYQQKLIKSRTSRTLRHLIFEECYKKAGIDLKQSQSCDLFQKDALDMLWSGINFYKLLLDNEEQYVSLIGSMDLTVYQNLILKIKPLYEEYDSLVDALTQQKEQVIFTIKSHVNDRSSEIVRKAEIDEMAPKPLIFTHHIEIRESLNGPQTTEHHETFQSKRIKGAYAMPNSEQDFQLSNFESENVSKGKQDQLKKQNDYMNSIINQFPPAMVRDKVQRKFGGSYIPMFPEDEVKK